MDLFLLCDERLSLIYVTTIGREGDGIKPLACFDRRLRQHRWWL
jgi:hypothetical protein